MFSIELAASLCHNSSHLEPPEYTAAQHQQNEGDSIGIYRRCRPSLLPVTICGEETEVVASPKYLGFPLNVQARLVSEH